ncbi:MAG: TIGR03619 family F420-dependent LLM class oxidoreductase [Actinomycetota bacterium]
MKFGVAFGRLNPAFFVEATLEAERLGFESAWLPEHLVLPIEMKGSPIPGQSHPPVPPQTPVFDAFAYLSYLAGRTSRISLGTHVYNIGLRHPFVTARAVQTLDLVSGGRAEVGLGASWLESEWLAAQLDFRTRGRRVDEAIAVCKRLWTEEVVEHHGEFFDFSPVSFEPKPVQKPWPPLHVGGESEAALRRAAYAGDGWLGLTHTFSSIEEPLRRLRQLRTESERPWEGFAITIQGAIEHRDDVKRWDDAGVDRMIVSPWRRSPEAIDGLRRFARLYLD